MIDDLLLDDIGGLSAGDPANMLAAVASSGAQMREAVSDIDRAKIADVTKGEQPRNILIAGLGGSGVGGDVLRAVIGQSTPVPIVSERSHSLPGWVGPMDVVIGVSCSGMTEETLSTTAEAGRRGARVITIGAGGSDLEKLSESISGAVHFAIDAKGRSPRASLWTHATPLLMVANALGIAHIDEKEFEIAADLMDELSVANGPSVPLGENPAKALALSCAESLPMVWGTGMIGATAAGRFMAQLAENAKIPSSHGELPEVGHNQIVTFDGVLAGAAPARDIFRDDDGVIDRRTHLYILRDTNEHPAVEKRIGIVSQIASDRNVPVTLIQARDGHPISRLASLIIPTDWASVYAGLALGIDPSQISTINQLKAGLAN
ncbi:MAG: mannose-6-phosphate isomerase [Actinobacteria bacterium]|nr:mannose-6-phosphate isomerase [Actinomycetota bacterium]NBO34931.1 mannose-6-phosphate isomerase [Actinomycetota bacterium]